MAFLINNPLNSLSFKISEQTRDCVQLYDGSCRKTYRTHVCMKSGGYDILGSNVKNCAVCRVAGLRMQLLLNFSVSKYATLCYGNVIDVLNQVF